MLNDTLETLAKTKGEQRYVKHQARITSNFGFGGTDAAMSIIRSNIEKLSSTIETNSQGQPFEDQLKAVGFHKSALVTLSHCMSGIKRGFLLQGIYVSIGRNIEAEVWACGFFEHDKKKAKAFERAAKRRRSSVSYRRQAMRSMAKRGGYVAEGWNEALRTDIGSFLVNSLLEACPDVFEVCTVLHTFKAKSIESVKEVKALTFTPWAVSHIETLTKAAIDLCPLFLPMTAPPEPWKGQHGGGYHDPVFKRLVPFVRMRDSNKTQKRLLSHAFKTGAMRPVLDAVNAIQGVPFKINTRILHLVRWAKDTKQVIKSLPQPHDYEKPNYPTNWEELPDEEKRKWKAIGSKVETKNIGLIGQRAVLDSDIETGLLMAQADRFWTPINLDFRGRVYGVPHFNFQRGDAVRAMFLFADGKPIGEEGMKWLAIHLAGCGDFDKMSKKPFDVRLAWVNDNLERILDVAEDPEGTIDWWKQADKPFLFVAACIEYAEALIAGPEYVSHLPVSWDGSCSGIQHLCMMMRSEEGRYVNLTPADAPQDVYQEVADLVNARLKIDAAQGNAQAKAWLKYGVTRKEVKRGVMTYAYSSRAFGMSDQLIKDLMVPLADKVLKRKDYETHPFGEGEGRKEAFYMGSVLCSTIEEFIKAPAEAMNFLRKIALALAHESKPVVWHTPLGLPVVSWYPEETQERIRLFLHDRGVKVPIRVSVSGEPTGSIKKEKSANGVAPNFVHSMDATHLMLTVNASVSENITQVALVHDSFGCLAADAKRYNEIIREQFVRLYTEFDVLEDIRQQAIKDITYVNAERVPEVPPKGSLDPNAILESQYAFA